MNEMRYACDHQECPNVAVLKSAGGRFPLAPLAGWYGYDSRSLGRWVWVCPDHKPAKPLSGGEW